jgi:hypothetical protein
MTLQKRTIYQPICIVWWTKRRAFNGASTAVAYGAAWQMPNPDGRGWSGEEATSATPYASVTETMTAAGPRVNTTIDL